MIRYCLFCLLVICLTVFMAVPVVAIESYRSDAPLEVTSRQLEADEAVGVVVFLGEVVAKQGDVVIYAGRLTVHYDTEDRQVKQVVAEEDVRIVQGDKVATGQHATYLREEGQIVLTGEPRVNQGDDFVSGEKITVLLNENRSIVDSGDNGRVNAIFHPRSSKNDSDASR